MQCESQPSWTSKAMFINAKTAPNLFTIDANGNSFPNIPALEKYMEDRSVQYKKTRKITMITSGPTFASYNDATLS